MRQAVAMWLDSELSSMANEANVAWNSRHVLSGGWDDRDNAGLVGPKSNSTILQRMIRGDRATKGPAIYDSGTDSTAQEARRHRTISKRAEGRATYADWLWRRTGHENNC